MKMHRLDENASGVFIISATPFTDNGSLDLESARCLTDFYIEKGVSEPAGYITGSIIRCDGGLVRSV